MVDDPRREAELAIARLETRKEMLSAGEEEDSAVIDLRARQKISSASPSGFSKAKGVLEMLPPWGRVIVVLALIVALGGSAILAKLAGWFGW